MSNPTNPTNSTDPVAPDQIDVFWTCGCELDISLVGDDMGECPCQFYSAEDIEDWNANVCSAVCPDCGARLYQRDGNAERVEIV